MRTINERATEYAERIYSPSFPLDALKLGYFDGATEQREIDIDKFAKYAEDFNKYNEEIGISTRIDVDSMRMWVKNILYGDEIRDALMGIEVKWESCEPLIRDMEDEIERLEQKLKL